MNEKLSFEILDRLRPYPLSYKIQQLRVITGYTQKGLSEEIGVTQAIICNWEKDKCIPSQQNLHKLASFYGIPADFFVDFSLESIKFSKHSIVTADIEEDQIHFK